MERVREERFEGLKYHQGTSNRKERVEASNSYIRTLIFGFFCFIACFIAFLSEFLFFLFTPFCFFDLVFYCLFSFFGFVFYRPLFFSFFFILVLSLFFGSYGYISTLPQLAWD
jgi:cellulose synthase/poly-beta-1,6-N-acetylglucosamine synthase-like glycosyltransferase